MDSSITSDSDVPEPSSRRLASFTQIGNTFSDPDENWTKISDLAERRRVQNRIAQRNYRKTLRRRLKDLERRAATSEPPLSPLHLAAKSASSISEESTCSEDESQIKTRGEQKKILLNRLMNYFFELFASCRPPISSKKAAQDGSEGSCQENPGADAANHSSQNSSGNSTSQMLRTGELHEKRRRDTDDDGEEDRSTRKVRVPGLALATPKRLACPYFKKDPDQFQFGRSCSGPGWETTHRMKEHLDRNHSLPPSCLRCCKGFKTERDRDLHMRLTEPCEVKGPPPWTDGFNQSQRDQLKSRPKGYKQMSETQKWRFVYLILFPETEEADIPSPYYEFKTPSDPGHPIDPMVKYEMFLRCEMPDRVRHQLELRIEDTLDTVEETLRGQIVDIVRDTQLELFQLFMSSCGGSLSKGPAVQSETGLQDKVEKTGETSQVRCEEAQEELSSESSLTERSWDDQLQPYHPDPFLQGDFLDFDGLLFDFDSIANDTPFL